LQDRDRIAVGSRGESLAARFLEENGYRILERGYRWGHKEIDIIASREKALVFVEVKSRSRRESLPPFLSVNTRKQGQILKVARAYLARHVPPGGTDIRFDVISIVLSGDGRHEIEHIVDAFRP
jgi:putative endonuclease